MYYNYLAEGMTSFLRLHRDLMSNHTLKSWDTRRTADWPTDSRCSSQSNTSSSLPGSLR